MPTSPFAWFARRRGGGDRGPLLHVRNGRLSRLNAGECTATGAAGQHECAHHFTIGAPSPLDARDVVTKDFAAVGTHAKGHVTLREQQAVSASARRAVMAVWRRSATP